MSTRQTGEAWEAERAARWPEWALADLAALGLAVTDAEKGADLVRTAPPRLPEPLPAKLPQARASENWRVRAARIDAQIMVCRAMPPSRPPADPFAGLYEVRR